MIKFYGLCAVILIFSAESCKGLLCYNCIYLETKLPPGLNTTIPSDISCLGANDTLPSERYLVDCKDLQFENSNLDWFNNLTHQSGVVENGAYLHAILELETGENIDRIYTCAKFVFNGTLNEHYENAPFRSTIRTCIPGKQGRPTTFKQVCNSGVLPKVINETVDKEVQVALGNYLRILDYNNSQTVACTCNQDYCNSSLRSATLSPFILVLLLSFLLIVSGKS